MPLHLRSKLVVIVVLWLAVATFASCDASSTPSASSQATTKAFPAFSDWRVVYMGADARAHAVTLNGKTDVTGPALPFAPTGTPLIFGGGIDNAGFGPDGHTLAYVGPQGFIITDLASNRAPQIIEGPNSAPSQIEWAPNGPSIFLNNVPSGFFLAYVNSGNVVQTPSNPFLNQSLPGGTDLEPWLDSTEVLFARFASSTDETHYQYYAYDVTSGKSRLIASMPWPTQPPNLGIQTSILPNRAKILYFFEAPHNLPNDPIVYLYDIASGSNIALPHITAVHTPDSISLQKIQWRPGTQTAALCTGALINNNLKDWLVDPLADTVTQLPSIGYPVGWSPDGKTLIFTSDYVNVVGGGPYTITALTFNGDGSTTQTVLTKSAMNFTFVGFVRTAAS